MKQYMRKTDKGIRLFFWQNTNSIHQASFFRELSKNNILNIFLIICEPLSSERVAMGWKEPELNKTTIIRFNDNFDWQSLISANNDNNCIHIFSGISAFPRVFQALLYARKQSCRIAILSEPLDYRGLKGLLRRIRGYLYRIKYHKDIEFILAIGWQARQQFLSWGYDANKVLDWTYTVEDSAIDINLNNQDNKPFKIIFAGSMILRKGYDLFIEAMDQLDDSDFEVDLYCVSEGNRAEAKEVESSIRQKDRIRLQDFLENKKVREKISEYDLLVLPSRYDGWGAVVSEALMEGTPVLVGYNCGSAIMLCNNKKLGAIIKPLSVQQIKENIIKMMGVGKVSMEKRKSIKDWAQECISADATARYFKTILSYYNGEITEKPIAPWLKK